MAIVELDSGDSMLQLGAKPIAILFISPEGVVAIQWFEGCSPEEVSDVASKLEHGVRFEDLK